MSYNLLKGKKGIIFGALDEKSIAWITAIRCHEEGAQIVLTNAPVAMRMGEINKLAEKINAPVIPCDVSSNDDVNNLIEKSREHFGGKFDFVLHSIGMSLNVRKGKHYTEIDYGFNAKTLDISAMSLHRVLATCMQKDALNDWGSVVALTYIAAQRVFPDYNEMADAKALLESVTRSFGYHYGIKKQVRINTISQSPTRTTAGSGVKGFDGFIAYAEKMSPLGNASAMDCANYIVTMFSDLTKMVTMQNLFHDGGFSYTGVTQAVIEQMEK
ncbi:MAG: SDR family oxidoreductase [Chitinophagaceae bacterium]|jgi:enoyl-[acyl-carrier protein] reductase I|nr:SDR family oxidoreductase [Chitinophagaceae bacterium]MBP6047514.1 SDR family oxidoreductase [Ferruginibacter sp.]MBK7087408.1 SDR family oxidoreductase [Chitinophagaceae bacterium]MBK7346192.1 SDR family oxidoreductase [Chitinophagaceae bacterium]MBK7735715.1 SDR family oxidoreductase [Chitinophagaceae bacterium]